MHAPEPTLLNTIFYSNVTASLSQFLLIVYVCVRKPTDNVTLNTHTHITCPYMPSNQYVTLTTAFTHPQRMAAAVPFPLDAYGLSFSLPPLRLP